MKKIGIIGCGWLGSRIAEKLSGDYQIYATTTSEEKREDLERRGYHPLVVDFNDETYVELLSPWDVIGELDTIIITVPFSSKKENEDEIVKRAERVALWMQGFRGQVFLMSSTGVYPDDAKDFSENDLAAEEVVKEKIIKKAFPQTNILRLGGLMGDDRFLSKYTVSDPGAPANHIHYEDVGSVIEKMIKEQTHSELYNLVAPLHPSKREVISIQKKSPYIPEETVKGKTVSSEKLISELDFNFKFPDPRYFHPG
ncbi:Rossmann-fold NAD(P)-binding domain-containing protein [Chryseobacterium pennipullorum]|uniref:Uncharacterized protein n=1 Tax=Chryseobacterium pennipullorum TaxID=2258963 RepID=A0A3D9ATK8_9FLAO|nr:NAD(P)-binding domain-containing protein [Chryseobacterium pennipullorum]REC44206.1 hypothetical protein DRF67_17915 [Chryseobacterium pennipullorum]